MLQSNVMNKPLFLVLALNIALSCFSQSHSDYAYVLPKPDFTLAVSISDNDNYRKLSESELMNLYFFTRKWNTNFSLYKSSSKPGTLLIHPNGIYSLKTDSFTQRGKWKKTGNPAYPIILKNVTNNNDWLIGRQEYGKHEIYIWDGGDYIYTGFSAK